MRNKQTKDLDKLYGLRGRVIRIILFHTKIGHTSWKVPKEIARYQDKIAFLRGFFDGDGSIHSMPRFFSTNLPGLMQVKELLSDLKYDCTVPKPKYSANRKPLHSIQVSRTQKARFLKEIRPSSKLPD